MAVPFRQVINVLVLGSLLSGCSYFRATKTPTATAARPAVERQTAGVAHVVGKGDTLFKIAKHYSGDGENWPNIARANPRINPNRLRPGQEVVIPFTLFAAAPVAYHEMHNSSRARLSPTAAIETASLKPAKKQSAQKSARTAKRPPNTAVAAVAPKKKTKSAAAKPRSSSAPDRISDEEMGDKERGDIPTEVAALPPPEPIAAPIVENIAENKVEPKIEAKPIEPKRIEPKIETLSEAEPPQKLAAAPMPALKAPPRKLETRKPEAPAVTRARPKSSREPAAPRYDVEPEQATRSSFYSCLADKCSLHSF